ncbi:putative disease resistance protein [Spatholobus suberectus]|nr:putative disease resistance protein [Spatholobus suberectus]
MAEEFLNHSNPSTSSGSEPDPEETGRGYLKELVGRSIFQVVEEDEFGKVRSCRMHPLMHDIARFVADKEKKNITVDPNGDKVHQHVQRASFDLSLLDFRRGIPAPLFDKAKQLRSILFFRKTQLRRLLLQLDMSETVLKKIFKSFKRLSVLDLRDLEIVEVPSSIGELEDLKYLDLSQNNMKKLPSSIAKLSKLETLKLSRCKYLKELPKNFESLPQLKHLDMEGCLGLTCMPRK